MATISRGKHPPPPKIQDGRQKEFFFFFKYMSSSQYQLWYNQIFAGFLMNVDDFLGKTEISMGNTVKYAKFWSFYAPIWSFLRVPDEAKTLENQIFPLCKMYIYQNVRHGL